MNRDDASGAMSHSPKHVGVPGAQKNVAEPGSENTSGDSPGRQQNVDPSTAARDPNARLLAGTVK
ncbi:MAG: hypothetical protein ACYC0U_02345 [Ilumatobacteraceae bacterium]